MSFRTIYYYISAYLDVSSLIPTTTNTDFEFLLYLNDENSLEYLNESLYPTLSDYHKFHIISPQQTITDVAVYSNPNLNQLDSATNVAFDRIGIVATPTLDSDPTNFVGEPFLNVTGTSLTSVQLVTCAVSDPNQVYVYLGGYGTITKISTSTFDVDDIYSFSSQTNALGEVDTTIINGGVIDSVGKYAYWTNFSSLVKMDLESFTEVTRVVLTSNTFTSIPQTILIDPLDQFLYLGTQNSPAKVLKIQLSNLTLVSSLTLNSGENDLRGAILNGDFGYFATSGGVVIRVNLRTMTRTGSLSLGFSVNSAFCAVGYTPANLGYFTGYIGGFPRIAKVDLSTSPNPTLVSLSVASSLFPSSFYIYAASILPNGQSMYVTLYNQTSTQRLVQVDLTPVNPTPIVGIELTSVDAVFLALVYLSTSDQFLTATYNPRLPNQSIPSILYQVDASPLQILQNIQLPYNLLVANVSQIDSQGKYMYIGSRSVGSTFGASTNTTPYAIKLDLETFEVVATVDLADPLVTNLTNVNNILLDSQGVYGYFSVKRNPASRVYKIQLGTFTIVSVLVLTPNISTFGPAVLDRNDTFAYFVYDSPGKNVLKINVNTMTEVGILNFSVPNNYNSTTVQRAFISLDNRYLFFGPENTNGVVYKVDLSSFTYVGNTPLTVATNQLYASSTICAYDPTGRYGYFTGPFSFGLSKVDLTTSPLPTVVSQISFFFNSSTPRNVSSLEISPDGKYAYLWCPEISSSLPSRYATGDIVVVDLETFQSSTIPQVFQSPNYTLSCLASIDPLGRWLYWVSRNNSPPQLVRMNVTDAWLSGLSTDSPSYIQNTTAVVDVDFKSQVAKLRSFSQFRYRADQARYLALYIKGNTGDLPIDAPLCIHTRLKVYPN